jgi:hypothetical protein
VKWQKAIRIAGLISATAASGCGGPTSATALGVRVNTIRYERVHPPAGSPLTELMRIDMSIPFPNEQSGRSNIRFCLPEPAGDQVFVCDNVGWDVPANHESWVMVIDPAVGRVARSVFVNGQRVQRIDVTSENETGRFRFDASGRLR